MSFEDEKVKIGREIQKRREFKSLSIQALADHVNMERSGLSKLEKGKAENPTLKTLYRIAEALDVRISDLVK